MNNKISGIQGTVGLSGLPGTSGPSGIFGTIGSSGIFGTIGSSGLSGTSGPIGSMFFSDELMKKYQMRFKIEVSSVSNSFLPTYEIIDNDGVVYSFTPNSMSNARQEVDEYISQLITSIRQERINKLITE
jgi:hypothetical protein